MKYLFIILLAFCSATVFAQLSDEYTTTVYEEVKHPYPLFDSLGVVSMEKYYYRVGDMQYEYYNLFENPEKDSALIFSYYFDSIQNKVTTISDVEYEEDIKTEYYLSGSNQIYKIKYSDFSFTEKRFLRKNKRREWYGIKTYTRDQNGVIISAKHKYYRESWKEWRKKGKKKDYKMDRSSYTLGFYNINGTLDSVYLFQVNKRDTQTFSKKLFYDERGQLDSTHELDKNIYWQRGAAYGFLWKLKSKYQPYRRSYTLQELSQRMSYDTFGNAVRRDCHQDGVNLCSQISEYNSNGLIERIVLKKYDKEYVMRTFTYDSLNRISRYYRNSSEWECARTYPYLYSKRLVTEPWQLTLDYIYSSDSSYKTIASHTSWVKNDTSYYNSNNLLIKICSSIGPCKIYTYSSSDKLLSIVTDENDYLKLLKYDENGLLIETQRRSYIKDEFDKIKSFYTYKN